MIREEVKNWLKKNGVEGKIEHPAMDKFGDFAVRTGRPLTELITNELIAATEFVAGFTNIWLKEKYLIKEAAEIGSKKWLENLAKNNQGKTMIIDYSAPNIAKPFGIGHLRSTNIGQSIYNIFKILGWKCIGDNHVGDWGTQFGKLIVAIKKWGQKEFGQMSIQDLEDLYVKFHEEAEIDKNLEDEGREWFAKLENGDVEARKIWQECVAISTKEFEKVYETLGVKIDQTLGESFYQDKIAPVMEIMKEKGLISQSQGAKIIEFKNMPPAMVEKTNGTTTYFARDMATIKYRLDTWQPDLIIYEIGADQELHCRQLFEAAKMMDWQVDFHHVAHGLIRWKDGKFSTRHGKTIHLTEVIEKAEEEARKIAPKNSREKIMAVAIGAIKFNDLAQDPRKDIIFDWEKVMSMEGNSGTYLQYTYARCRRVGEKSLKKPSSNFGDDWEIKSEERALLSYFYQFEEKILEAAERFSPAVLAEYLLNLARKYNEFYGKWRIVGEKEEEFRLFLTDRTAKIIETGLRLLGIEALENM